MISEESTDRMVSLKKGPDIGNRKNAIIGVIN